jgi:type II secretory pathway component PulL
MSALGAHLVRTSAGAMLYSLSRRVVCFLVRLFVVFVFPFFVQQWHYSGL